VRLYTPSHVYFVPATGIHTRQRSALHCQRNGTHGFHLDKSLHVNISAVLGAPRHDDDRPYMPTVALACTITGSATWVTSPTCSTAE